MKNRLLATLLTLVIVPLLANETAPQQPNNSQFLIHLKNIKSEAQSLLQKLNSNLKNLSSQQQLSVAVWNDIYDVFDPSSQETTTDVKNYFDFFCTEVNSVKQLINSWQEMCSIKTLNIITEIGGNLDSLNDKQKQQYQLLISIASKQLKD